MGFLVLCFFCCLLLAKRQHQLAGIGIVLHVQAVIAATLCPLNKRLRLLGVPQQELLYITVYLLHVGLGEQCIVKVIDVLGQLLHTYTPLTDGCQYL